MSAQDHDRRFCSGSEVAHDQCEASKREPWLDIWRNVYCLPSRQSTAQHSISPKVSPKKRNNMRPRPCDPTPPLVVGRTPYKPTNQAFWGACRMASLAWGETPSTPIKRRLHTSRSSRRPWRPSSRWRGTKAPWVSDAFLKSSVSARPGWCAIPKPPLHLPRTSYASSVSRFGVASSLLGERRPSRRLVCLHRLGRV